MSLRIHVCNDEETAKLIIETQKIVLNDNSITGDVLSVPDIMIYDYSHSVDHPSLINQNKVCVVFKDK